jgi:GNAT superfamily N-acetyltransferase
VTPSKDKLELVIKSARLELHGEICIRFREDSFIISFGNADKFHEVTGDGAAKYLESLKERSSRNPDAILHVWHESEIVGQIELGDSFRGDTTCGYVNLFYLIPSYRGRGLGGLLEEHALKFFKTHGFKKVVLTVSPKNSHGMAFYKKRGWENIGGRIDNPGVVYMEKKL